MNACAAEPVCHFGCGLLATGVAIPLLLYSYGTKHKFFLFQRRSSNWNKIVTGSFVTIKNSAGDSVRCHAVSFSDNMRPEDIQTTIRNDWHTHTIFLFIFPDEHFEEYSLVSLNTIHELSSTDLIVSCSLGNAQNRVLKVLCKFTSWSKFLLFENSLSHEYETFVSDKFIKSKCYHILVDRICWHIRVTNNKSITVFCCCEKLPVDCTIHSKAISVSEGVSFGSGVTINSVFRFTEVDYSGFSIALREKRALVNSSHSLVSLLCCRLLFVRGMEFNNQYLAPLHYMLQTEYPEWEVALNLYLKLRAFEVALLRQDPSNVDIEYLHAYFDFSLKRAKKAVDRFFQTNDLLSRLIRPDNFIVERVKFKEHLHMPIAYYNKQKKLINECWLFDRPNFSDLDFLNDFFETTFEESIEYLDCLPSNLS